MEHIGRYKVIKTLIVTGFSNIYLCRDTDLEVEVAIKVFDLKEENAGEKAQYSAAQWLARFVEEAKLMARLEHANIVRVFELSATDDGKPYFVMPFIEANLIYEIGRDEFDPAEVEKLDPQWRPKRASVGRTVFLLGQILDALAYLHGQGIVHRDLKPGNVLLTRKHGGEVRLCDFGMVKLPKTDISRSGVWIGTLDYMAPEQRRSAKEVDARADVYSAGAVAYRMLTGTLPEGAFPPPREVVPEVPRQLSDLLMHALARDPKDRPGDAGEMRHLLRSCLVPWQNLGLAPIAPIQDKPQGAKSEEDKSAKGEKPMVAFKKARGARRKKVNLGPVPKAGAVPELRPLPNPLDAKPAGDPPPVDKGPVAGLQDLLSGEAPAPEPAAAAPPAPTGSVTKTVKGGRRIAIRRKGNAEAGNGSGLKIKVTPKVMTPAEPAPAPAQASPAAEVVAVVRRPVSEG